MAEAPAYALIGFAALQSAITQKANGSRTEASPLEKQKGGSQPTCKPASSSFSEAKAGEKSPAEAN